MKIKKMNEYFDKRTPTSFPDGENRISLSMDNFETLISGGIIKQGNVQISLQDIGYDQMISIIQRKKRITE